MQIIRPSNDPVVLIIIPICGVLKIACEQFNVDFFLFHAENYGHLICDSLQLPPSL